jgi:molybdopterin converting factor small subunit
MKVGVRLFANLREFAPEAMHGAAFVIELSDHAPLQSLLATLHLPDHLPTIVLVNGSFASETTQLTEGDTVSIFPPLIGGRCGASCAGRGLGIGEVDN